jgi:osmoprotectant transport system permease protein
VPTLALLTLLGTWSVTSIPLNGLLAPFLALTVLAIPPILTNAYVGVREVDADVTEAARAMGLTGWQVMRRVELPLGLPFIIAGVRTAAVEVVATSTLAAYTGYQDLGTPVLAGLSTGDTSEALYGALLVALTAALVAIVLGFLLRLVTPAPLRRKRRAWGLLPAAPAVDAGLSA